MRVLTITQQFLFSNDCTRAMLFELAVHPHVGYTQQAAEKLFNQQLNKTTGGKGGKSHGVGDLQGAKLRTCIVNKLQNNPDVADSFKAGAYQFEMQHLADEQQAQAEPDINSAGSNKAKRASSSGPRASSGKGVPRTGGYKVAKQGVKCTPDTDPDKWQIWQHVWNCTSFEQYFAQCPAKGVTKTGRVITAYSEMNWAIKSGWIVPVQQQA